MRKLTAATTSEIAGGGLKAFGAPPAPDSRVWRLCDPHSPPTLGVALKCQHFGLKGLCAGFRRQRMRFSIALLTALTLAGATSAKAVEDRPDSANAIMPGCRASLSNPYNDQLEAMMAGVCVGTVNGLIFEASVLEQMSARSPHAEVFCAPEEVTIDQALRVVVAYIDASWSACTSVFHFSLS